MAHEWKYRIESPQTGMMELSLTSEHELVELINKGVIDKTTMVVSATRTNGRWVAAGRVPALARLIEKRESLPPTFDTQQDQRSLSERLPMAHEWKYKGLAGPEFGPISEQFLVELINDGRVPDTAKVKSATRTNGQWFEARKAPVINVMIKSPAELAEIKKRPPSKPLSNEPLDGRVFIVISLCMSVLGGLITGLTGANESPAGFAFGLVVIGIAGMIYLAGVIRWAVCGSESLQLNRTIQQQNDEIVKLLKKIADGGRM